MKEKGKRCQEQKDADKTGDGLPAVEAKEERIAVAEHDGERTKSNRGRIVAC